MYLKKLYDKLFNENVMLVLFAIFVFNKNLVFSVMNYNDVFLFIRKTSLYLIYVFFTVALILGNVLKKKKINKFWLIFVFLSFLVAIVSKNMYPIILVLIVLSVKDYKLDKIVNACFYGNLVGVVLVLLLSYFGIIENWTYNIGGKLQNSLGYNYSSIPATYVFVLCLMRCYLKKANTGIFEIILKIVLAGVIYNLTYSLTSFILIISICIFEFSYYIKVHIRFNINDKYYNKFVKIVLASIPVIIVFFSLTTSIFYNGNNSVLVFLDNKLSNRLYLGHEAIENYGIPILGKNIKWVGNGGRGHVKLSSIDYNFVDNSYIRIILDYGVLYFILIITMLIMYQINLVRKRKIYQIFIQILIFLWAISEPCIMEVEKNVFLIPVIDYFFETLSAYFKRKEKKECNEKIDN